MIKEAYCSFEVAKLLKEKGFDEPCRSYFINDGGDYRRCAVEITNKNCTTEQTLRPTHQMAMAWLREEYHIFTRIGYNRYYKQYKYDVFSMDIDIENEHSDYNYSSYEEAVEAALKYSLENLIKETEK